MEMGSWHYPPADTACCTIILVYAFLYSAAGIIILSPCDHGTVDLLETREDNIITCSGIPVDYIVNWQVTLPSRSFAVGACDTGNTVCTNFSVIGYLATRPSPDTSLMSIDPRVRADFVKNGTLECRATKALQPDQAQSCQMNIVSPPSSVKCTMQPDTSASSAIGRCNVTKVYSHNGNYSCRWYNKQGSAAETEVTDPVERQITPTADTTPTGGKYVNVVFNVNITKWTVETSYRVFISPGGVSRDVATESSIILITVFTVGAIVGIVVGCVCGVILLPCGGYGAYVGACWYISKKYRKESRPEETPPPGGHSSPGEQPPKGGQPPPGAQPPSREPPLTGGNPPPGWHVHYLCGIKIEYVYFSQCCVSNGCIVFILSKSPNTQCFIWCGTEGGISGSGAGREMGAPPSHSNNVSPESGAVKNGSKHTSQKEKNKHIGTDGSPRKSRQPEAPVELTTVRTSSPPQAATVHGDNQASGTPHGDHQASGTPRLRPLPEPSRMTSVERNSTAEYSNML